MDTKADRYGYLRKTGAIGVCTQAISVKGSTRGKGALGSSSVETKGLAKRANLEGNESAHYEKLEKRSLRSMKQGGSEKELRQGHNDGGKVRAQYSAETNPIRAAKQARRGNVMAAKASGEKGAVKAAKQLGAADVRAARGVRKYRNEMGMHKSDMAAGRMARKEARMQTKSNRMAAKDATKMNRESARSNLVAARQGVKAERGALREAMQTRKKAKKGLGALV